MNARLAPDPRRGFAVVDPEERRRRLGIDGARRVGPLGLGASLLPEILGDRVLPVRAVHEPDARVVYFDHELADELGIAADVDDATLVRGLSWRILPEQAMPAASDRPIIDVCCDRYGGVGLDKSRGAGRAIILPWGNLVAHGVGPTPLATPIEGRYGKNLGYTPMVLAWSRMVRAWVYDETFCLRSNRILAILDWGERVEVELDGDPHFLERRGVFVRAGLQFRPAHALEGEAGGGPWSRRVFVAGAEVAGVLVRDDAGQPDWRATLTESARRHAELQAQAQRHRILHGALSTSNMGVDGAMLDVEASTSQPGTAPILSMDMQKKFGFVSAMDLFGFEQLARAHELQVAYDAVRTGTDAELQSIDVLEILRPRFERALEEELIAALGLKHPLACALVAALPEAARELRLVIERLMRLIRPGSRVMLPVPRGISAVKVMDVFLELPSRWVKGQPITAEEVRRALALDTVGLTPEYAHQLQHQVLALSERLAHVLSTILEEAAARAVPAYHLDETSLLRQLRARSGFSNRSTPTIERDLLERRLRRAMDAYDASGDLEPLRAAGDGARWAALRNVDRLLRQGTHAITADGALRTQARRVRGGEVALRVDRDGAVALEIRVDGADPAWVMDACVVTHRHMIDARLVVSPDGVYRWPLPPDTLGELLVTLRAADDGDDTARATLGGYTFVAPDALEARAIVSALSG